MKIIKGILVALLIILAIPLITALFIKQEYHIERQIIINQPKSMVFNYVKYLKNQGAYSKWNKMDPDMKKSYKGADGTTGFVAAWESENPDVGKGEQEILKITDGKRIDYELRFFEPFEQTDKAFMIVDSLAPRKTKVIWGFDGKMNYPMNLMFLFMDFDKMLGDDLKTGLESLKGILDNKKQQSFKFFTPSC